MILKQEEHDLETRRSTVWPNYVAKTEFMIIGSLQRLQTQA